METDVGGVEELWITVAERISRTAFQEVIVFCPKCEDRGMDTPVLTKSYGSQDTREGVTQVKCFKCSWSFCGICRSPCHPNESCYEDPSRALRMGQRRPPLPPDLAEKAAEAAVDLLKAAKEKIAELQQVLARSDQIYDFDSIRRFFFQAHEQDIRHGLSAVFSNARITPVPLAKEVGQRFAKSLTETGAALLPAFHGTDHGNYPSIFKNGLLIPGDGNALKVVHGAAHGRGVYTANVDAAWLSQGFCTASSMLVCAVLDTSSVRRVGDAMVVGMSAHVVPMFEATGKDGQAECYPPATATAQAKGSTTTAPASKGTAQAKGKMGSQHGSTATKSSKFMARLAKKSQKH